MNIMDDQEEEEGQLDQSIASPQSLEGKYFKDFSSKTIFMNFCLQKNLPVLCKIPKLQTHAMLLSRMSCRLPTKLLVNNF